MTTCPALIALLFVATAWADEAAPFPGAASDWNGFVQHQFSVDGQPYVVVEPKAAVAGRPWIWRAEFFGHEPQADIALLGKGWHVAHCPAAAGHYGSPKGVAAW